MKPDLSNKSVDFVEPSKRADTIFNYLAKVRGIKRKDILEGGDYSPEKLHESTSRKDPIASNTYSKNFVSRLPHISSDSRAFSPTTGKSIDYTGHIMPGNRINKKAAGDEEKSWLRRLGETPLSDVNKAIGKYTVNPVIQSLMYGGLAGLGMYAAAPTANKYLERLARLMQGDKNTADIDDMEMDPDDRMSTALWTGLGIGALNLARHINFKDPSWDDLWHFHRPQKKEENKVPEKPSGNQTAYNTGFSDLPKYASMLGPVDYVPKSFAMNAVTLDPSIPDYLKYNTLNVLGNISGGDDTMINSTDMVNSAISSGLSGSTGLPLGRIAAAATADALMAYGVGSFFGVKDPGALARNVGIGSAAIRGINSLL